MKASSPKIPKNVTMIVGTSLGDGRLVILVPNFFETRNTLSVAIFFSGDDSLVVAIGCIDLNHQHLTNQPLDDS